MHSCVCTYLQAERERIENSELQRLAKVAPLTAMCDQVLDSDQPASDLAEEQVSIYMYSTARSCRHDTGVCRIECRSLKLFSSQPVTPEMFCSQLVTISDTFVQKLYSVD